jgi:hypothetical protein
MARKKVPAAAIAMIVLITGAGCATNENSAANAQAQETVRIGHLVFEGGDGRSMAQAVIIKNAANEMEGVGAEARWINKVHPGWLKGRQALLTRNGKAYDRIEYRTPDGKTATIFFDITGFFGKF